MTRKVIAVIKREYMTRVKTKGFIASLVLMPLLMFVMIVFPSLIAKMQQKSAGIKTFVVFDETREVFAKLEAAIAEHPFFQHKGKRVYRVVERESDFSGNHDAKRELNQQLKKKDLHGYLEISEDVFERGRVDYYAKAITNFEQQGAFREILSRIIIDKRFEGKGYAPAEIRHLTRRVHLETYAISDEDTVVDETVTGVKLGLGYILIFLLYVLTINYATYVMRSVLEEKTTRIVEVIVSSIEPYQLLLGKLLGVCSVCLTMFAIWGACGILLVANIDVILRIVGVDAPPELLGRVIAIVRANGGSALLYFAVYFVCGFFLFSTLYAAVGAICNSDEEAQQTSMPLLMLIILPFVAMFGLFRAPDAPLTVVLSHIPFFSPILMFMRINVLKPPLWEILLNIAVMIATILGVILVIGKIYKVGILMYGKRPSVGELWRWLRY